MGENIQHEQYKGHDIRSSPVEVLTKKRKDWRVRIDITFPAIYGATTHGEYFDETQLYSTVGEAHTAGFEFGRRKIDKSLQNPPTSSK